MNIDRITKAIEDDAGEPIEGLSESLAEMKAGKIAREYTPEHAFTFFFAVSQLR